MPLPAELKDCCDKLNRAYELATNSHYHLEAQVQDSGSPNATALAIVENVSKVIVGKTPAIEQALAALIAEGHILVEDVSGVGKTMLAKSLSVSIGCSFKRI